MMQEFARSGVAHACISPGSCSTAIITGLLRARRVRPWVILDERSAGFFALGMARETRRPVIPVCTSGTAAANYLPAFVEASLSKIPLIVITADRPPEARDCRSAQTIDQVRMFGSHAQWSVDLATPAASLGLDSYYRTIACRAFATATEMPAGPVHLNLPMPEPLIDVSEERKRPARISDSEFAADESRPPYTRVYPVRLSLPPDSIGALAGMLRGCDRGLIVCGHAAPSPDAACSIARLAGRLNWPVLADPLSGLRAGHHDRSRIVDAYDVLLCDPAFCEANQPDAVIQFGDPPVSKSLGQFLASGSRRCRLMVAEPGTWPDPLQMASDVARVGTVELCDSLFESLDDSPQMSPRLDSWLAASARSRAALDPMLVDETTMFEGKVVAELMRLAPDGCAVGQGHTSFKLKVGARAIPADVKKVAWLRMAIGNDFSIRLDANRAWTLDQAEVALHAFQPYGIELLEEPLRSPEPGDMRRLSDATGVALALDESISGAAALSAFIEHDAADYLVLKSARLGGPTRCVEIARLARTAGIKVMVTDSIESAVGMSTAVHLASALSLRGTAVGAGGARFFPAGSFCGVEFSSVSQVLPDGPGLNVSACIARQGK
jgi:2-succinyl-5-enolpyruvyl-6-hydroxy-3-cyclohexene-1-carboxylate synthase